MNNLDSVIEILKKEGILEEDIEKFVLNLNNALSQNLYLAIVNVLDEEDMKRIDSIEDKVEAEKQMRQIFEIKTGTSIQNLSDQFVNNFVKEFLEGYKDQNQQPQIS